MKYHLGKQIHGLCTKYYSVVYLLLSVLTFEPHKSQANVQIIGKYEISYLGVLKAEWLEQEKNLRVYDVCSQFRIT